MRRRQTTGRRDVAGSTRCRHCGKRERLWLEDGNVWTNVPPGTGVCIDCLDDGIVELVIDRDTDRCDIIGRE